MKRIVTVQDISCVGKCSLTVALPIISAMGVETAIIPTAVLSTHTMFSEFTCKDLTDQIRPITKHWQKEGLGFDAVYTGYLGSFEQIDLMAEMFDTFRTQRNMVVVDPAMADNGKLYPAFDPAFAKKMATLCGKADIIVPNITEASFMTDTEYRETYDEAYVKELLQRLAALGSRISILTGVGLEPGTTGAMGYDREKEEYFRYTHKRLPASYHGTGDIFSSSFTGALVNGLSWKDALEVAAEYTAECIRVTMEDPEGCWYGVNFETVIPYLLTLLERKREERKQS
ncbi:MAG: pyridoxamine kinase [Lachnospiraceae bacterium]|nr:pyridoxamine kinase [Lachnospiraceae bacterium]